MTFKTAVDNLVRTYEKYGFTKEVIEEQIKDGIMNQGFSVNVAYNGVRMVLAQITGKRTHKQQERTRMITLY